MKTFVKWFYHRQAGNLSDHPHQFLMTLHIINVSVNVPEPCKMFLDLTYRTLSLIKVNNTKNLLLLFICFAKNIIINILVRFMFIIDKISKIIQ